jgi:hypothetical protein
VNNNMRQRGLQKQAFAISIIFIFLTTVYLSGCTDTKNTDNSLNSKFIGTWTGSVEVSTFGGPMGGNSTFTKLTFMQDIVAATITNDRGTNTMNYTYTINGNNLILEPTFSGGFIPGRQSNGTQPYFNNTMPPSNNTRPFNNTMPPSNGTRPPFNNTWSPNGQQPPGGQQSPSISLSFSYSFDENYTFLYLDGSKFIKIQ